MCHGCQNPMTYRGKYHHCQNPLTCRGLVLSLSEPHDMQGVSIVIVRTPWHTQDMYHHCQNPLTYTGYVSLSESPDIHGVCIIIIRTQRGGVLCIHTDGCISNMIKSLPLGPPYNPSNVPATWIIIPIPTGNRQSFNEVYISIQNPI